MRSKEIIIKVKQRLWDLGYVVKDLSDTTLGFHLLVEGKVRVLVMKQPKDGQCGGDESSPFDTVALVSFDAAKRMVIMYTNAGEPALDPRVVFGEPSRRNYAKKSEGQKGKKKSGKKEAATAGGAA